MKKIVVLTALAVLLFALAPAAHAGVGAIYSTGFESGEASPAYTGSTTGITLLGQGGWTADYGESMWVHTYAGNQVAFPLIVPVAGMDPQTVPTNPNGGAQFVADHGGGVKDVREFAEASGEVEFSVDYYAGPQFSNTSYNGGFNAQNDGTRIGGWITHWATSQTGADPASGPWAPGFQVYNADGTQLLQGNGDKGYISSVNTSSTV
jgi:hypothetical protein